MGFFLLVRVATEPELLGALAGCMHDRAVAGVSHGNPATSEFAAHLAGRAE
jgi:hypothetical protein